MIRRENSGRWRICNGCKAGNECRIDRYDSSGFWYLSSGITSECKCSFKRKQRHIYRKCHRFQYANIGLVLGISGIFYPILIKKSHIRFDYLVTLLVSVLFYGLSYNGLIGFWEGILLFTLFIGFNIYLFKSPSSDLVDNTEVEEEIEQVKNYSWFAAIGLFLGGVLGLYFGSELLVTNAVKISREFGVSERIIGVTIIAIGTSLPELITSIIAALSKRTDLALGNILGSNIMNILSIIGLTAIIMPIGVSQEFINSDFLWMIGITLFLFVLMRTKMKVSKVEGSLLLLSYFAYLYFLL